MILNHGFSSCFNKFGYYTYLIIIIIIIRHYYAMIHALSYWLVSIGTCNLHHNIIDIILYYSLWMSCDIDHRYEWLTYYYFIIKISSIKWTRKQYILKINTTLYFYPTQ